MSIIAMFIWFICLALSSLSKLVVFFCGEKSELCSPRGRWWQYQPTRIFKTGGVSWFDLHIFCQVCSCQFFVCDPFLGEDDEWVSESVKTCHCLQWEVGRWVTSNVFVCLGPSLGSLFNWMMLLLGDFLHHLEVLKIERLLQVLFVSDFWCFRGNII